MLSRFREETLAQKAVSSDILLRSDAELVRDALEVVMMTAARTVLVSGSTLSLCFAGLTYFEMSLLRSTGIGASLAVAFCVMLSLTRKYRLSIVLASLV